MRRSPYHCYPYHHRRAAHGPFGPALLVGVVLLGVVALLVWLVLAVLVLAVLALAPVAAVAIVSTWRKNRRRMAWQHRPVMAGMPLAAPIPQRRPAPDWAATRARFARLRSEYGQFECDPLAILRLPALTDVTVPATGRFVDAFAEAQALDTETEPSPGHCARFATAVEQAWSAWHAARDTAERIRLSGIPAQERATVQRAIKLLTMARDSHHEAERAVAYSKARTELAKLDRSGSLRLPPAAAATLAAVACSPLPPAPAVS